MIYLDTSVLVSLLVPEPESPSVRDWIGAHQDDGMATSDWAVVEFASAMGLQVRSKGLKEGLATQAIGLLNSLAADSLHVATPSRGAFVQAAELVAHFPAGLRAGDALHLATAMDEGAAGFATLDRKLIAAARKLKLKIRLICPA
jgi:predicted nucleic acid-binding protein